MGTMRVNRQTVDGTGSGTGEPYLLPRSLPFKRTIMTRTLSKEDRETIALVWSRRKIGVVGKKLSEAEKADLLATATARLVECPGGGEVRMGYLCIYICDALPECEMWEA